MVEKTITLKAEFGDDGQCRDVDVSSDDDVSVQEVANVMQVGSQAVMQKAQTLQLDDLNELADEVDPSQAQQGGRR